uniref:DUF834 domain-containing protein n=1 Tax=Oryza barthii TaxID=65489 RepID=A0A0D3G8B7_9ORYZ
MDLSSYVDGGSGSGVKKVTGGGDRRRSLDGEGGSGRSPGVPDPVVLNHLETGSGTHHLEATTGDHHRSSGTKKIRRRSPASGRGGREARWRGGGRQREGRRRWR